jgi:signal transduction histidine kinase/CheY-like chemotaxis protein
MSRDRLSRSRRLEGIARLIPSLGQPASRAEAATRLCDAVRSLLGASASALFLNEGVLTRVAHSGFALLPPDGLPASLEPPELERLRAWAAGTGLSPLEVAPLRLDDQALGALVLCGGAVEPLTDEQLQLLGRTAAYVIEQARTVDDLRRAYDSQERTQDQVVRSERLRVLGEVALGIAHDFNNVLNAMLGQVGVLELLAASRPELSAPIERLKRVALEGAATVSRLQDFSRQRRDQEFAELDLSALCHDAVVMARERGFSTRVGFDERIEAEVRVAGAPSELRDVLEGLIENAIEAHAEHVVLLVERHGDEARLTVSDDGAGMSKEVRKRAFDPFFTTKGSLASGLGLSVAYGILRRHGGRIDLESAPGQGTRVKIRLPALGHGGAQRSLPQNDPPARGGIRLLLVEDDADNREAMATLLSLGGHTVVVAALGSEGVRRFNSESFDVVLTDLGLPDMTGWEVARQVKEVSPSTPVALITGWGLNLDKEEIRRRGVDLLIKKPIDPRRFLEQLASLGGRVARPVDEQAAEPR